MVAVLLLILKIIGILLLSVLGLVLVLLLLVLFWPIGYRLTGDMPDPEHRKVCLRVRWLSVLVRFLLVLDESGEPVMCLRILGIPVWRSPGKGNPGKRNRHRKAEAETSGEQYLDEETVQEDTVQEDTGAKTIGEEYSVSEEPKKSVFARLRSFPGQVKRFFGNLHRRGKDLGKIIGDERNRQSFGLIWKELKMLLIRYGPRKIRADVEFGTADPALTGQVLGVLSMLPFIYRKGISIRPDFNAEQLYLTGTADIRGRIQVCHLLGSLFRLYKDQNVKRLLGRFGK